MSVLLVFEQTQHKITFPTKSFAHQRTLQQGHRIGIPNMSAEKVIIIGLGLGE